jgi:hypothetical protein
MMLHPLLMAVAILTLIAALLTRAAGGPWWLFANTTVALIAGLALERLAAGVSAARRFRTPAPLVFPLLHLGRDLAWVAAIAVWLARRVAGRPFLPAHSMRPRASSRTHPEAAGGFAQKLPAPTTPPGPSRG